MYKYTIMTAAVVVVLASLVNSVPANSMPTNSAGYAKQYDRISGQESAAHSHNQVRPDNRGGFAYNENSRLGDSNSLIESGVSGLLEAIHVPKRIIGNVVSSLAVLLRSINLKGLVKIALVGFAVVVLGAVAAAASAGIAAVVTALWAAAPYARFFFGHHNGEASESEMESISRFVLSAFDKYENNMNNSHE